ncbi:MAG: WD40/YVTN/BNR-like repeat-containing protein [Promethearchaeota archaeon]
MKVKHDFLFVNLVFILLLNALFLVNAQSTGGWIHRDLPNSTELKDLKFLNSTTGWVVGSSGDIYFTSDGGLNWIKQHEETEDCLYTIDFYNEQVGWALGSTFLKTEDGGATWLEKNTLVTPYPVDMVLYNRTVGWAVSFQSIFVMNDGENWVKNKTYPSEYHLYSIEFTSLNNGWINGLKIAGSGEYQGILLKTTDAGETWTEIHPPMLDITDISFINENFGYVLGIDNISGDLGIWKTVDGGSNWIKVGPVSDSEAFQIEYVNEDVGWMASSVNFYYTTDGGISWQKETFSDVEAVQKMQALNQTDAFAVGNDGMVLYTNNCGINSSTSSSGDDNSGDDNDESLKQEIPGYNPELISMMIALFVFAQFIQYKRARGKRYK